jgi:hypothetical protein
MKEAENDKINIAMRTLQLSANVADEKTSLD